jgi:hypothetical protein
MQPYDKPADFALVNITDLHDQFQLRQAIHPVSMDPANPTGVTPSLEFSQRQAKIADRPFETVGLTITSDADGHITIQPAEKGMGADTRVYTAEPASDQVATPTGFDTLDELDKQVEDLVTSGLKRTTAIKRLIRRKHPDHGGTDEAGLHHLLEELEETRKS